MSTTLTGTYVDITDYLKPGELSITPTEFAPKKGRAPINGTAYGGRVALPNEIKANCQPLTQTQTSTLLPMLKHEYVYLNYLDPAEGWRTGVKFLSGNIPATALMIQRINGNEVTLWDGISFTLSEVIA